MKSLSKNHDRHIHDVPVESSYMSFLLRWTIFANIIFVYILFWYSVFATNHLEVKKNKVNIQSKSIMLVKFNDELTENLLIVLISRSCISTS